MSVLMLPLAAEPAATTRPSAPAPLLEELVTLLQENTALRLESEALWAESAALRVEHVALQDRIRALEA